MADANFVLLIAILCATCFGSFLCIFLHEMGHAVPALFLTKSEVTVYIGLAPGQQEKCMGIGLGRLRIYLTNKPWLWMKGFCVSNPDHLSIDQRLTIVAGGPVASLLTFAVSALLFAKYHSHLSTAISLGYIAGFSFMHSLYSIVPTSSPIYAAKEKNPVNHDGKKIAELLRIRKLPDAYWNAATLFQEKQYFESAELLTDLIQSGKKKLLILRLALAAEIKSNNLERASEIDEMILNSHKKNADDWCNSGIVQFRTGNHDEAIKRYKKALSIQPKHAYALNNLGFELCLKHQYEEAMSYFDKSIALSPNFAMAYANKGYALLFLGNLEQGHAQIRQALRLDPEHAYAHRNLGIYHLTLNNLEDARESLEQAKALDPHIYQINGYVAEVYRRIDERLKA